MKPIRGPREVSTSRRIVRKLHSEIMSLRTQLSHANATIDCLTQENLPHALNSRRAESLAQKFNSLSPRERVVARLFLQELCDKKVARQLGTRPQTVRNQITSIEKKLGVESREELVLCLLAVFSRPDGDG
jgi:DNA-binding NarL/FixJ family response regulator